jgi:drug/metabolite transporter (DMT)-like permease
MPNRSVKGYLFTIISAVIYGLMPLMSKAIYADGVNALTLVFLRNLLALPSLALLTYLKHRTLKIPTKALPGISMIALFGCCLTPILLCSSYNYISTGTATVFHFIYPSLVVLIGFVFLKKKVSVHTFLSVLLCFGGICLFYDPAAPFRMEGCLLSLSSALTFAIYVTLLSNRKHSDVNGLLLSFSIAVISSVLTLLLCLGTGGLALPKTPNGWLLSILFAFLITTVAVVLFQQGTALIGGEKTSILSALEPITSVLVGVAVFQESITVSIAIGALLVVSASILIVVSDRKKRG